MMALEQLLNRLIADWSVLYVKLHHYHWYVKGDLFFTLHEKFEEWYEEAAENTDVLAERLLAIGGQPLSTMKAYLEHAAIEEAKGGESADEMVAQLVNDYERLIEELKAGVRAAEEAGDEPTADVLLGMLAGVQKHVWMLRAFGG
jgi:starvation-inducible DNA-binding protein